MKNKIIISLTLIYLTFSLVFVNTKSDGHEGHDDAPPSYNGAPLGDPFFISKQTQFILGIETVIAQERQLNFTINSTGKIIPTAQGKAEIFSPLPGKITQRTIPNVGMNVNNGTTLLTIEQTLDVQSKLSVANEKFKAEAEYEQAVKDYERLKELEGVAAEKDILSAEIRLNSSEKTLDYYESVLQGKENLNNYFQITSPISGVIVESDVSIGEQLEINKKLFTIVNINTLWVEAEIYETDIAKLRNVSNANVTAQTYPDENFDARLVNIGNVVDDVTRTVKVIFEVKNKNKLLKVGMFANINININTNNETEVLTVPKESIVDIGGKNVVFIHTKAQAFKGVEVLLGRTDGQYVEILNGVSTGARVVTTGNYQLRASVK
ncbi:MAG: efflux RND transporter periplasmic adaptor subunit [Bacteroidota bacterium]|nr:efflux RND transporter periplasmic adaptor subunit [Bacteroidota bacterium]